MHAACYEKNNVAWMNGIEYYIEYASCLRRSKKFWN